jgi:hypothetical protein
MKQQDIRVSMRSMQVSLKQLRLKQQAADISSSWGVFTPQELYRTLPDIPGTFVSPLPPLENTYLIPKDNLYQAPTASAHSSFLKPIHGSVAACAPHLLCWVGYGLFILCSGAGSPAPRDEPQFTW